MCDSANQENMKEYSCPYVDEHNVYASAVISVTSAHHFSSLHRNCFIFLIVFWNEFEVNLSWFVVCTRSVYSPKLSDIGQVESAEFCSFLFSRSHFQLKVSPHYTHMHAKNFDFSKSTENALNGYKAKIRWFWWKMNVQWGFEAR